MPTFRFRVTHRVTSSSGSQPEGGPGSSRSFVSSVHETAGVHSSHGSCVQFPPPVRRSDVEISGQLADSSVISGGSLLGKGQSPEVVSGLRDCCQSREVLSCSLKIEKFLKAEEFLSSEVQSAKFWRVLLSHLVC